MRAFPVLLVVACGHPPASPRAVEIAATTTSPAVVARTLQATTGCPLHVPDPLPRGSVVQIPPDAFRRALAAAVDKLCACARPGDRFRAYTVIESGRGTASVHAVDEPSISACLEEAGPGRFEPFLLASDCIHCGPRHFDWFHDGGLKVDTEDPRETVTINYPLTLEW
jgi:hypothetical protein